MIRHLIILHFREGLHEDYPALLADAKRLVLQIPGLVNFVIYSYESRFVPDGIYCLGVEIVFEDRHALDVFMEHPKHYEANALFEQYLADPGYMVLTHEVSSL